MMVMIGTVCTGGTYLLFALRARAAATQSLFDPAHPNGFFAKKEWGERGEREKVTQCTTVIVTVSYVICKAGFGVICSIEPRSGYPCQGPAMPVELFARAGRPADFSSSTGRDDGFVRGIKPGK